MIQLRIKEESDLYNPYDPTNTMIRDGVYHYLKSFCTELEFQNHMNDTLRIVTDNPIDEDKFRAALHKAVSDDLKEFDRQLAANKRRVTWEYIVGIGLSILGVSLSIITDKVLLAIISFLGSAAISNAITIQSTVNHDIKQLKKRLDPFRELKIEVVQAGEKSSE
jgi:hypothetical protein